MAGARITASWADSFVQTLKANDIRLVSMVKPRNLTIVIMDNGVYQITGKQPAATASTTDIVAIARGAGDREQSLGARRSAFRCAHRPAFR
jgi:hypothetical protein